MSVRVAMKKNGYNQQRGFTLIEVLLVVVIIGVITGIAIPSFLQVIRKDRIKMAADGISSFIQGASIEVKKTRRTHSILFVSDGATLHQSGDCSGAVVGSFTFDEKNAAVISNTGNPLGSNGIPAPMSGWGLYGGATVGSGWKVGGKNCATIPAIPAAFGNTLAPGGVLIRYLNDDDYGAWVFKTPNDNRLHTYVKEGDLWVLR